MNLRCEDCPFQQSPCVGSYGPVDAPIAIVGEAPAAQEVKEGRPFIGPSGILLQKVAKATGLPLDECFITNTLRCRLPEGMKITTEAIDACNDRLIGELAAHPRKLVVTLGGSALNALSPVKNPGGILSVRGQRFVHPNGFTVLPTIHPALVLRQGTAYPKLVEDIKAAVNILNDTEYDRGTTRFAVIEDDDEVIRSVKGLMQCEYAALDIESASLTIGDHILAVGIAWEKNKVLIYPWEVIERHRPLFQQLFTSGVRWIFHNAQFDTSRLQAQGFDIRTSEDTFLLYGLLDETAKSASLKDLAATELGALEWTQEIDQWLGRTSAKAKTKITFQVIPRPTLHRYLANDADNTLQLWPILRERVRRDKGLDRVYRRLLIPASNFLREVEMYGMYIDPNEAETLERETRERVHTLRQRLVEMAREITNGVIADHNPNSTQQVSAILYEHLRLTPIPEERRYFTHTTSRLDLERLIPHEYTATLMEYRRVVKAYGTYVLRIPRLADPVTHRLHTSYNLNGTKTGRLSSRPGILNIPRVRDEDENPGWVNSKRLFAAPPNRILIEADYSQAELRLLGLLSGDPVLIDVYQNDRDLHTEVAINLFGTNYTKDDRDIAKRLNFGVIYGLGASNLARIFKMPIDKAKKIIDDWYALFAEARRYLLSNAAHINENRPIRSPFGRLRRWGIITRDTAAKLKNEAMNAPIQSGASDFTLYSAVQIQPFLKERDASVINTVYDSIIVEAPDNPEVVREISEYMKAVMIATPIEVISDLIPFKVDVKVGRNWGLMSEA